MSAPSSSTSTLPSQTSVPSNNTVQSCSSMNVGSPQIHSFSFEFMETLLHAQIWFMRSSILLWIGDQSATMHSLTLAIKSSMDSTPSVSCLLGHGHALGSGANPAGMANGGSENEDQVGNGMAARIASIFGIPVFVSLNLSPSKDSLIPDDGAGSEVTTFVERTIIKELKACDKLGMIKKE